MYGTTDEIQVLRSERDSLALEFARVSKLAESLAAENEKLRSEQLGLMNSLLTRNCELKEWEDYFDAGSPHNIRVGDETLVGKEQERANRAENALAASNKELTALRERLEEAERERDEALRRLSAQT